MRITLLAVCLLLTSSCKEKPAVTTTRKPVARLTALTGNVDHRSAETLVWQEATRGMALYNHDAVKTGQGATASVSFLDARKLKLQIEEQSLVIIDAPVDRPGDPANKGKPVDPPQVARLERGTLRGVIAPGAPPVQVVTASGEVAQIRASSSEAVPFRLRVREKGKLEVAVLKGSATVRSGGSQVQVKPHQVVEVTAKQVSQPVDLLPYPVLVAPPVDDKVQAGTEMELRWTPVEGAAMYRVQISHTVSFAERLFDNTVVVPGFKLPAPRAMQTYVWRVASVDRAGRESEFGYARRFHVRTVTKPRVAGQLLHPAESSGIQFVRGRKNSVTFRWSGDANHYALLVARDKALRRVVARRRVDRTEEVLTNLGRGTYFWGVYALDDGQRSPLFTEPYRLVITTRRPPYVRVPKTIKWKQ